MNEIRFVDTTLRDGQESLWATSMRTAMILPVARDMDEAGFEAIEIIATTNFKKQIRDLKENPWERIRRVAQQVTKTPLRAVRNRYMAAFQITPTAISNLWLERVAANGIKEVRLSDPSNSARHWKDIMAAATAAGLKTIINLIYSVSPRHTEAYYAERAREAAKLAPYRVCFKDPGGLLTPEQTRKLVPVILSNSGNIPVELHTHCNTGLGPLCCLEAAQLGIRHLNSALPPLANGSSNPSLFNLTRNLRAMRYHPLVNEQKCCAVSTYFQGVAKREKLPFGAPVEYQASHVAHQVPGGMISNFRYQLAKAGMEHRLPEVLEEIARVRADLGYPIMVTPYSQFVGVQATLNIIIGARYAEVPDEVVQYALGLWGDDEAAAMDPTVRDRILDRPRAKQLSVTAPEIAIGRVREQLGGSAISDDELLLRYFSSPADVEAMNTSAAAYGGERPIVQLIERLAQRDRRSQIYIRTPRWSLRLERRRE